LAPLALVAAARATALATLALVTGAALARAVAIDPAGLAGPALAALAALAAAGPTLALVAGATLLGRIILTRHVHVWRFLLTHGYHPLVHRFLYRPNGRLSRIGLHAACRS
jgi:hypothetical protein